MTNKTEESIARLMDYNTALSLDDRSDIADQLTRTNTGLEEAQSQVRALTEAIHGIKDAWESLPAGEHQSKIISSHMEKIVFPALMAAYKALSPSPIELYKAERAVIEAGIAFVEENSYNHRTERALTKAVAALQELEHNITGGES